MGVLKDIAAKNGDARRQARGYRACCGDRSVFSKNRDRPPEGDVAAKFLNAVLTQPRVKRLLSSDHFSVSTAC